VQEGSFGKKNPTLIHPPSKCGRCVQQQAPRALYYRVDKFLQDKGFKKGTVDDNLYIKSKGDNLLVVLVYVDDIIFGCTNESSVQWFANSMQTEFEISMIGGLSYFLGLKVK
jgi:hypothetical protein